MTEKKEEVKRTIGFDCHPDSFTAAFLLGSHAKKAVVQKVTDQIGLEHLEDWLKRNCELSDVLVMEASANSFEIFFRASSLGYQFLILESCMVGRISKECCINDKSSAIRVARVFLSGLFDDTVWIPDPVTRERREILGSYMEAVKDQTRIINRIKSFLNEYTVRMPGNFSLCSKNAKKRILSRKKWSTNQRIILEEAFNDLERCMDKEKQITNIMAEDISKSTEMLQVMRVFGIGTIIAYAMIAVIGNIKRFSSPKKLVSYLGFAPQHKDSGNTKKDKKTRRNGRKEIRALIVQGAQSCLNFKNSPFYKWAWSLVYRKGHTINGNRMDTRGKKIAVMAIGRKMITAVWYLLNGLPFKMQDITTNLLNKFRKLAAIIGVRQIRKSGYRSYRDFAEKTLKKMYNHTCCPT